MKGLAILGATGSIGTNVLKVVDAHPGRFRIVALAGGHNMETLARQVEKYRPGRVAVATSVGLEELERLTDLSEIKVGVGEEGLVSAATETEAELIVAAAVGAVGLVPTFRALEAGKDVALANKEALVMAGELMVRASRERGGRILPIDSEHCALQQCLEGRPSAEVRRLVLTASGGPFRERSRDSFGTITPEEALNHPTWEMGRKITIDSATLMNKGLEVIEARWLFEMPGDRIDVLIHPQSLVHSMVEFVDGSVLAQLAVTDMRLPIQYALTYPERVDGDLPGLDFSSGVRLDFEQPDREAFPCLDLAYRALEAGGTHPAVLNAANEEAVAAFAFSVSRSGLSRSRGRRDAPCGSECRERRGRRGLQASTTAFHSTPYPTASRGLSTRCRQNRSSGSRTSSGPIAARGSRRATPLLDWDAGSAWPTRVIFFGELMEFLTNFGTNLVAFIVVLGVMIFFHEFGHFITAKAFGMRVFIFSFGFGKRLIGFKWGDTDCRVSAIPLGGYVKLEGEPDDQLSEEVSAAGDERDFTSRPRWQRIVVYLAGPAFNFILTIGILTALFTIGFRVDGSRFDRPIVGSVEAGGPAEAAGLRPGDEIVSIDGTTVKDWEAALYNILIRPDTEVRLEVRRGGTVEPVDVSTTSGADKAGHLGAGPLVRIGEVMEGGAAEQAGLRPDDAILRVGDKTITTFGDLPELIGESGGKELMFTVWRDGNELEMAITPHLEGTVGRIGVTPKMVIQRFGFVQAIGESVSWSWNMTKQTFQILGRLATAQLSPKTMMGPIGIAKASGDAARGGVLQVLFLVAVISLQIGILNLFPVPPLDGGHLAILFGESILRRDFSLAVKMWIMNAGAAALFLLIGLVLYSDLSKTSLGRFLP